MTARMFKYDLKCGFGQLDCRVGELVRRPRGARIARVLRVRWDDFVHVRWLHNGRSEWLGPHPYLEVVDDAVSVLAAADMENV